MKLLRKTIRKIILEGPVKDEFDESWYNVEEERGNYVFDPNPQGSQHRENLRQSVNMRFRGDIDPMFKDKRDLKRLWNETIDKHGLRSFWEGPKMKYFHSLSYYDIPQASVDKLAHDVTEDRDIQDLTAEGFFHLYDKTGNRDEMSTYGIYNGVHSISRGNQKFGVIISGRVTLAADDDIWTESRSKATSVDLERHKGSGLPKRMMAKDSYIQSLLFEEQDIIDAGKIGECVLDNWSIEAIVCRKGLSIEPEAADLARKYGVPLIDPSEMGVRGRPS